MHPRETLLLTMTFSLPLAVSAAVGGEQSPTFERDIRPIFRAHCDDCHGATQKMQGGLDLRLVRRMLTGGESGPAIVSGRATASYLIQRLRNGEMPPGDARLTDKEISVIARWIDAGARTARPEPETIGPGLGITPEERNFWAFQPVRRPTEPNVPDRSRVRTSIDAFVLAAASEGASFADDAERLTLIKRAYFALTGLPPSPAALDNWLEDPRDDWFQRLVDALLASPHYGERWARYWLDVAGYADSEGYTEGDVQRKWAWKYRDWVIRALNDDKPYHKFVVEQLAGDELAGPIEGELTPKQIDLLTATGFLRMSADGTGSGANEPQDRNQVIADTIRIVCTSLVGLSVHCSQCHDHRYDPIPQTDYYALRAVFEPALDWQQWKTPKQRLITLYNDTDRKRAAEVEVEAQQVMAAMKAQESEYMAEALKAELDKYDEPLRSQLQEAYNTPKAKRSDEQKALLFRHPKLNNLTTGQLYLYIMKWRQEKADWYKRIEGVRAKKPPEHFLRALIEPASHAPQTRLFHRGDHQQPKQVLKPAPLTVTSADGERRLFPLNDDTLPTTGRRLAFARWLTSSEHPLVARVIVNRVWMHHFGHGIVNTPSDFGRFGARPSHPELLDWLATEFVRSGWSLKRLHRLIMTSTVWRQQSDPSGSGFQPAALAGPPTGYRPAPRNLRPLMRLEAETIRDRMLAASGTLEQRLLGVPDEVKEELSGEVVVDSEQTRRSIYVRVSRSQPLDVLQAFDAPVMETNCERRSVSTVATQSLMLLNGDFVLQQARHLAARATREATPLGLGEREALPTLPASPQAAWQFGYGGFDDRTNRTAVFTPFAHWSGKAWQGGPQLPDPTTNHAYLNAHGGHPGGGVGLAVIRRWTVPADGLLTISGSLSGTGRGNGVRGRIVSSRHGLAGEWIVTQQAATTTVSDHAVKQGDLIDIIVDDNGSISSDTFKWPLTLTLVQDGHQLATLETALAFHGPLADSNALPGRIVRAWQLALCRKPSDNELRQTMDFAVRQLKHLHANPGSLPEDTDSVQQVLTNLCQVLLGSNEFLYID